MRNILLLLSLVFIGSLASAQTYSLPNNDAGCPNSCRVVPWQAGSDLWNGGTLPVYGQVACTPLNENGVTDDTTNINNCITAANAGTGSYATCHAAGGCAVFLPAGTILVNGTVRLKDNVVLRGATPCGSGCTGAGPTYINEGASAVITTQNFSFSSINGYNGFGILPTPTLLSGTPQKGDTTVTCSTGCGAVSVGTWIKIFGNDDPSIISDTTTIGGGSKCDWCGDNSGFYVRQQIVQVTNIAGSVWTISRPLYYAPDTVSRSVPNTGGTGTITEPAGAKYNIIVFTTQKAGFENIKFTATGNIGATQILNFQGCLFCWVKGVETQTTGGNSGSAHVELDESYGAEIRDSYFHDQRSGASGSGYGVYFQFVNSDHKIENNIIRHNRHSIVYQGGGSGTAILFNYMDDQYTDDLTYLGSARTSHGAHPFFNLFEGNAISHLTADDCWGTSSHDVMYRNWLWGDFTGNWTVPTPGTDAPTPSGSNPNNGFDAIDIYSAQTYYSMVGNVLGHTGLHAVWSGATVRTFNSTASPSNPVAYSYGGAAGSTGGCDNVLNSTAPSSNTTSINHGNFDYKTNGVAFWEGGANHTLANSIYYPSGPPAFMAACQWPMFGPEGNPRIGVIPAQARFTGGSCTAGSNPQAATPTFSPSAGSFNTFQNITISDTSSGAIICFNVSGSPATNGTTGCAPGSALYTAPFQLSATTTVFAVAGGTGFSDSAVASITYTINPTAQLPAVKVNNTEYIGTTTNTINFPNSWQCGVTTKGPYANTCAGLQSAANDAEACRNPTTGNGTGTTVKIPHASTLSGGSACLTLNQTAGDNSTNFIVFTSDTPLPLGTPVCSHGIQDNVSRSTQIGLRNLGCDGSHVSYQLGTTIFSVNYALDTLVSTGATAITLANGTVTTTSAYNDKASMYHLQCTTVNCSVISTGAPDATTNCSGGPCSPHHYAILNGEFNPIGGPAGTIITYNAVMAIGTQSETTVAMLPNHIHIGYSYIHGDIGDAPLDPITQLATGGPNGSTAIANGVAFLGCTNCSLVYSYFDQLLRPSGGITNSEGHTFYLGEAGQIKSVHNWGEGSAIGMFSGGWVFTISLPDEAGADVEDRASRWTYPYSWTLAREAGFCYNNLSCPVANAPNTYGRKNAHESKTANRWLTDGDILEHSDNSGGQSMIKSIKVESCCEAYTLKNQNTIVTNNILRDGCQGTAWGFRSSLPGNGGAASLPTQLTLWQNNLSYDIGAGNPACSGATAMGFSVRNNISQVWPTVTCVRTSGIATCTLAGFAGNNQSDMNIGDPVTIVSCVDTTFNTDQTILNPALPGTTPTGLTIIYSNAGADVSTPTTGCKFDYSVGWPRYLVNNHNSEFNKPTTAVAPYFVGPGSSTASQVFSRNLTFTNDIFYGGGIFASGFSEGLKVFQIPAGEVDTASFTFNNNYFADRDARASCTGHGAGANGIAQCYIEYSNAHVAIQPPVTISGIPTASGDFCGAAGLPVLNDWHDYRLAHGEAACGSVTSPFANAATDGTDLGFNYAAVDAAQTSILYPAPGFFSDTPVIPATFFGLHWKISNFPPLVPSGSVRLWDSLTRWQLLNPSNGVFDFTNLDTNLQDAKTLGVDVLFTLSTTPNYISSDPTNATCNYNSTATGGCGVPTDIAASCTNVNGNRNCDGKVDGTNQHWRTWVYTAANHVVGLNPAVYAIPSSYEIWNEASQQGTSGAGTCAQIGGTSWEGTCAQMVRMYADANCILTGRGAGCSAGSMGVPAVGIFPAAIVTSPSSVMTAPESNWYGAYLLTSGATTNLDIAAVHGYTQGGSCCAQPETIITRYASAAAKTSAASFTGPIWSTEGGWGQVASEPDVDLQAAFVARYYLLGWNAGFQRLYWYSYDSLFGTLWTSGGGLTKAGVSYGQIYNYMVGSILSTPCAAVGTVWSCVLTTATGDHLIMWDTAQTCSGGSCTTANQLIASTWLSYQDMTTVSTPIAIAATHLVPIGAKPVIFQQSVVSHGAGVNPVILGMNRGPE